VVDSYSPPWLMAGLSAGSRLAGYQLVELIGRGGMAVVFRAHDQRLDRQVALKILAPALADDDAFQQRFMRESRAAAAVDDPNIIPVYEAGEAGGVLFIAMRLVRGGNLRSLIARSAPLPLSRADQIVSATASALDAAHAAGLVHRDVKPANILLESRRGRADHVYLSDFGLSKAALGSSGLTVSGQFLGTVDYASPEQIQGLALDGRADQYALGCSAFETMCGKPPFLRDQGLAAIYAHLSETPPPPSRMRPELSPDVDAVFAKVLSKSPADRYESCQDFADALHAALGLPTTDASAAFRRADDSVRGASPGAAAPGGHPSFPDSAEGLDTIGLDERSAWLAGISPPSPTPAEERPASAEGIPAPDPAGLADAEHEITKAAWPPPAPAETPPLPGPPDEAQLPERQQDQLASGSRRRQRPLILASLAALVAAAAIAAILLIFTGSKPAIPAAPATITHTFPAHRYGIVVVARMWTIHNRHGSTLTVQITAHSSTRKAIAVKLSEPIPAAIAPVLGDVTYQPQPARVLTAKRIAEWNLNVPSHGDVVVSYRSHVSSKPITKAQFTSLMNRTRVQLSHESVTPIAAHLTTLKLAPGKVRIHIGQTRRLRLTGRMSDGSQATAKLLAKAHWKTSSPSVATVRSGKITARRAGKARISAKIGNVTVSAVVTVIAYAPASQPTYQSQPPPPSSTPSPHPTGSPTPTPTI
jgi:serine/threonine protein kinase